MTLRHTSSVLMMFAAFVSPLTSNTVARAEPYKAKPKLVVVLVLDQFREDYLERYRSDFKTVNGFNLFLNKGANFTDCYFEYANTMTAPGHATIGTGSYWPSSATLLWQEHTMIVSLR